MYKAMSYYNFLSLQLIGNFIVVFYPNDHFDMIIAHTKINVFVSITLYTSNTGRINITKPERN